MTLTMCLKNIEYSWDTQALQVSPMIYLKHLTKVLIQDLLPFLYFLYSLLHQDVKIRNKI